MRWSPGYWLCRYPRRTALHVRGNQLMATETTTPEPNDSNPDWLVWEVDGRWHAAHVDNVTSVVVDTKKELDTYIKNYGKDK